MLERHLRLNQLFRQWCKKGSTNNSTFVRLVWWKKADYKVCDTDKRRGNKRVNTNQNRSYTTVCARNCDLFMNKDHGSGSAAGVRLSSTCMPFRAARWFYWKPEMNNVIFSNCLWFWYVWFGFWFYWIYWFYWFYLVFLPKMAHKGCNCYFLGINCIQLYII